jgi:hypothetical protein
MISPANPQTGKDSSSSPTGLLYTGLLISFRESTGSTAMTSLVKIAVFGNLSAKRMAKQWLLIGFGEGFKLGRPANSVADMTV